jgi:DNA-binding MarR family transcriptional regulator
MLNRDISEQVLRSIRRIIRRTSEHSRQVARETGLTIPQALCLRAIAELNGEGEATVAKVSDAVQLASATVSRILDRMEEAELIVRERRSKDRRKVCLTLTDAGAQRLRDLPPPLQGQFVERLVCLPEAEQRELLLALEKVVELMGAAELDAAPVLDPKSAID